MSDQELDAIETWVRYIREGKQLLIDSLPENSIVRLAIFELCLAQTNLIVEIRRLQANSENSQVIATNKLLNILDKHRRPALIEGDRRTADVLLEIKKELLSLNK
jgi:hypothetical protein